MVLSLGKYLQIQKKYSTEKSFIVQHTVSCFTQLTLRYVYVRKKIRFCADFSNYRESTAERERMNFSKCQTGTTMNCQNDYGKTKTEHTHTHTTSAMTLQIGTQTNTSTHTIALTVVYTYISLRIDYTFLYTYVQTTPHAERRRKRKKKHRNA